MLVCVCVRVWVCEEVVEQSATHFSTPEKIQMLHVLNDYREMLKRENAQKYIMCECYRVYQT